MLSKRVKDGLSKTGYYVDETLTVDGAIFTVYFMTNISTSVVKSVIDELYLKRDVVKLVKVPVSPSKLAL